MHACMYIYDGRPRRKWKHDGELICSNNGIKLPKFEKKKINV